MGDGLSRAGDRNPDSGFFLKLIPKVGPFSAVNFKIPTKQTEDMYIKSVDVTVEDYSRELQQLKRGPGSAPPNVVAPNLGLPNLVLPNLDFDTGHDTRAGEYVLCDKTYARLLDDLSKQSSASVPPPLRQNLLQFYSDLNAPIATKKDKKAWRQLLAELANLGSHNPDQHSANVPVANPWNLSQGNRPGRACMTPVH